MEKTKSPVRKHFWQHDIDARDPEPGESRRVIRVDGRTKRQFMRIESADPTNVGTKRESWAYQAVFVSTADEATHFNSDLAGLEKYILGYDELGRATKLYSIERGMTFAGTEGKLS